MSLNAKTMGEPDSRPQCPPYDALPGVFDEMCAPQGEVRTHWRYLIDSLASMGPEELAQRQRDTARMLRSDGATYNIYGTPDGLNQPWKLDPIPLLISSSEWAGIETGLAQRAELFNLILADLYGPRSLIRNGLLPADLVYTHPGFLRACAVSGSMPVPRLTLYAADLARSPDGGVWVFNDRSQAPSGAGYALENRTVMSRLIPSLFRDSHPHRLASFFRVMRQALADLAPVERENPRVVIMTPGPLNETYFEHLYLANYLDYTLIEGAYLTVRDGRVWLKSVSGLEPVDVILRRIDDHFCDPLELRPDSLLGVAGLTEVVRQGRVSVANPLGSGVLECPGMLAFLPRMAKHFLGQELALPSVATWWCGQTIERDYVLANLHRLVLRPAHRRAGQPPVFGEQLSRAELESWRERIRARPHLYVGQERHTPSSVPALRDGVLEPRPAILRAFLVARQDTYVVLPGGMTRVGIEPGSRIISSQAGAVSKDTWVLASEPERMVSLLPPERMQVAVAAVETLPGVAAENLYWVARYMVRVETVIRLIRNIHLRRNEALQLEDPVTRTTLEILLRALTHMTRTYPGFTGQGSEARLSNPLPEIVDLIINPRRTGTLAANLTAFLRAAYTVRDVVSSDVRRIINEIGDELAGLDAGVPQDLQRLQDVMDRIITALMAIAGATGESMSRELGWQFLSLGRRIERSLHLISLVRAVLVDRTTADIEALLLESVLSIEESFTLYRRRYRHRPRTDATLDLLLLDETNPRSLVWQVREVHRHIASLPGQGIRPYRNELRLMIEASTRLSLADAANLAITDGKMRTRLDILLASVDRNLCDTSDALTETYFTHAEVPHQLLDGGADGP
jgi:uncharacterized circularly permuted ATP-grasp superfamily protein/uncharacterized alpha-E superfamily protein